MLAETVDLIEALRPRAYLIGNVPGLQGFPPGWRFEGKTKAARWAQIGMAMPPALAAVVARAVRRALGGAS
jgi:site-specific DNA-cytosine methylase